MEFLEDLSDRLSIPARNDTDPAGSGDEEVSDDWPPLQNYHPGNHTIQLMVRSNHCSSAIHGNNQIERVIVIIIMLW